MPSKCLSKIINSFNKLNSIRSRGYTEKIADRVDIELSKENTFIQPKKNVKGSYN